MRHTLSTRISSRYLKTKTDLFLKGSIPPLLCLLLLACGSNEPWDVICTQGETVCSEQGDSVNTCRADGMSWNERPCGENTRCIDGTCQDIGTLPMICETGHTRCPANPGVVERCNSSGTSWEEFLSCEDGKSCLDGLCLAKSCSEGQTECGPNTLYTCNKRGQWESQPCPEENICILGRCVECIDDRGCSDGEICEEGVCQYTEPKILTSELPSGVVGTAYEISLAAEGGAEPLTWSLGNGFLPSGIELTQDGILAGTPVQSEKTEFMVKLIDHRGATSTQNFSLEIYPEGPVHITTKSLTQAKEGRTYAFQLTAVDGYSPYGWQILDGALPEGLSLDFSGKIAGVPTEIGAFPLKIRVLDGASPPSYDAKDFTLDVSVSPLEIMGGLQFDLLFVKIIILPPLIPFFPYAKQLEARGGVKPYSWSQTPAPPGLGWIIPKWGLPAGLKMDKGGKISGRVTNVSDATTITIPGGPNISGYFFMGKVTDSRSPAKSATAIFCIPTVPL